jgi:hypothetical protein
MLEKEGSQPTRDTWRVEVKGNELPKKQVNVLADQRPKTLAERKHCKTKPKDGVLTKHIRPILEQTTITQRLHGLAKKGDIPYLNT